MFWSGLGRGRFSIGCLVKDHSWLMESKHDSNKDQIWADDLNWVQKWVWHVVCFLVYHFASRQKLNEWFVQSNCNKEEEGIVFVAFVRVRSIERKILIFSPCRFFGWPEIRWERSMIVFPRANQPIQQSRWSELPVCCFVLCVTNYRLPDVTSVPKNGVKRYKLWWFPLTLLDGIEYMKICDLLVSNKKLSKRRGVKSIKLMCRWILDYPQD